MTGMIAWFINPALAAAIGYLTAGWVGGMAGPVLMLALSGAFTLWQRHQHTALNSAARIISLLRAAGSGVLRLVGIPLGIVGSVLVMLLALIVAILSPLAGPLRALKGLAALPNRLGRFIGSLFDDAALPWTLGNATLLLVIGVLVIGIDLVFYVALIAVPLLLLALAMLAITGGEDPEASAD